MDFIKECGIMLEPQQGISVSGLLEIAQRTEKQGFGYLCRSDHLIDTWGRSGLDSSECWVTLGAIAARTKFLKFGPLVSPIGFRNPGVLARMAWTLHTFAPGRLQLGVGAGWYEDEYVAHGIEFPPHKVRDAQFGEALQIIRPFTQGEKVDFHGKYFSAQMEGHRKVSGKVHLVIGGSSPTMIRRAAQYADEWNSFSALPEKLREPRAIFDSTGREIHISLMCAFLIGENESELRRRARARMRLQRISKDEGRYIKELRRAGTPVETVKSFGDRVNEWRQTGIEKVYFQVLDTGDANSVELLASVLKEL